MQCTCATKVLEIKHKPDEEYKLEITFSRKVDNSDQAMLIRSIGS